MAFHQLCTDNKWVILCPINVHRTLLIRETLDFKFYGLDRLLKKDYPSKKWRSGAKYTSIGITVLVEPSFSTEWVLFGSNTSKFTPTEQVEAVINGIEGLDHDAKNPLYANNGDGGKLKDRIASTPRSIHNLVYMNTTKQSNTRSKKRFKADSSSSSSSSSSSAPHDVSYGGDDDVDDDEEEVMAEIVPDDSNPYITKYDIGMLKQVIAERYYAEQISNGNSHFVIPSGNGRNLNMWYWPAVIIGANLTWTSFQRRHPRVMIEEFLKITCGNVRLGVCFLISLLSIIDNEAAIEAIKKMKIPIMRQLTPEETMSIQAFANLSITACKKVNRFLKFIYGISLFATEDACSNKEKIHAVEIEFADYKFNALDVKTEEMVEQKVQYLYVDPYETFVAELKKMRDMNVALGIILGQVTCLAYVLLLDHGGSEMKACITVLANEADCASRMKILGIYKEKDTYDILKNTLEPHIVKGLSKLSSSSVLIL